RRWRRCEACPLAAAETTENDLSDRDRDRVFYREDLIDVALIGLAPHVESAGIRDRENDPHPLPGPSERTVQHIAHTQLAPAAAGIGRMAAAVAQRRVPAGDAETGHLRQPGDDLFREPVGDGGIRGVAGKLLEVEDRE